MVPPSTVVAQPQRVAAGREISGQHPVQLAAPQEDPFLTRAGVQRPARQAGTEVPADGSGDAFRLEHKLRRLGRSQAAPQDRD
jgi:hypothetical protein